MDNFVRDLKIFKDIINQKQEDLENIHNESNRIEQEISETIYNIDGYQSVLDKKIDEANKYYSLVKKNKSLLGIIVSLYSIIGVLVLSILIYFMSISVPAILNVVFLLFNFIAFSWIFKKDKFVNKRKVIKEKINSVNIEEVTKEIRNLELKLRKEKIELSDLQYNLIQKNNKNSNLKKELLDLISDSNILLNAYSEFKGLYSFQTQDSQEEEDIINKYYNENAEIIYKKLKNNPRKLERNV